jgi:excisionase family DNA binding protein
MSIEPDLALELLTIPEVAKLLKISASGVRRLQQARQLTFIKVGGSVRFSKRDIASYLKVRRVGSIDQIMYGRTKD